MATTSDVKRHEDGAKRYYLRRKYRVKKVGLEQDFGDHGSWEKVEDEDEAIPIFAIYYEKGLARKDFGDILHTGANPPVRVLLEALNDSAYS